MQITIQEIDGKPGIIFPQELLKKTGWKVHDILSVHRQGDGFLLKAHHPDYDQVMEIGKDSMQNFGSVYKKLSET